MLIRVDPRCLRRIGALLFKRLGLRREKWRLSMQVLISKLNNLVLDSTNLTLSSRRIIAVEWLEGKLLDSVLQIPTVSSPPLPTA
jgi:hypothetical protein